MNLVLAFGVILATVFAGANAWKPYSPEETLFVYTRCMEDNFKGDYELLKKWIAWELPMDPKSACYAKCVLVRLELFDENSKSFKGDHVVDQYNKYKQYTGQDEQGAKDMAKAVNELGSVGSADCVPVVQKYLPIHKKFKDVQRNVYFGKKEITDKIYAADQTVKKRDETIFRFCERTYFQTGSQELCTLRKTGITTKNEHLDCLFRGLRYLDRNGNIDPAEVKRDLHLVNVKDKDAVVDDALKNCNVVPGKEATSYNDCLWKNPQLKEHMMPAFDYREVRSESYRYFLGGPKPYNKPDVDAKVRKYDKDAGC